MYDYVIVTHIPAFYKVNLYNELSKKLNILVVFIALNTAEKRADDFITLDKANFEYQVLFDGDFQDRDLKENIFKLRDLLKHMQYKKMLVSGWDLKEFWYLVMFYPQSKNCLALESTILESTPKGIKGWIKKVFLSRISTVFASGNLHVELLKALNFKGNTKITRGVGIINKPIFTKVKKEYQKRFLFIGRLSSEKNIDLLIDVFNDLEEYTLTIIGAGPLENELKAKANSNIFFQGYVENTQLKEYFLANNIFILLSIAEPWGLVIEEALYFNMPVIVSKNCGASELIEDGINGYVVDIWKIDHIKANIININDKKYQEIMNGCESYSVCGKDKIQVDSYL